MKEYTIILKKSGDQYVSLCLELTVVGCGDTRGEAIASVKDAIESYVDCMGDEAPIDRPISLQLLHDFLSEGEADSGPEGAPRLKVLAYG
ncbi:MAG: type II toxin-antitoxin system HicB family antitoxin [Dehalococcoidia bacterium]